MSVTVSLAVLVAAVRRRADMRGSLRYTDAEIALEINRSAKALDSLITTKWDCLYRFKQASPDLSTTANQAYVALPTDFKTLIKIGWVESSGSDPIRLDPMGIEDEWEPSSHAWTWNNVVPRYQVRGLQVWLSPIPTAVYTLRLQYVPVLPTIEDSTPTPLEAFTWWDEWVINDVAAKLLIEEESDASAVSELRDRAGARIEIEASRRDIGAATTVQKVRRRRAVRGSW